MTRQMIMQGQKPRLSVVISKEPTEQETYAARELVHYLDLMGSVSIPLRDDSAEGPVIALGSAAKKLGVTPDPKLSYDGFTLKTVGDSLAIVGGIRGLLYGVYEFLEKLGCRFFTPFCEKVPSVTDVELPELDETQIPVLEYRQHNYTDLVRYPRFGAKCRVNAGGRYDGGLPDDLGGGIRYAWFVHSFKPEILDPEEWYDTHPEYFSLVNGRRLREYTQLCLTNPDVRRIAIGKVRAALRAHPECRIISVSQNDWKNPCECENCARLDAAQGSCAGSLISFVNAIAEAIEEEFPEVIVDTLAYTYTRPAPKTLRPRHNVCVRLCTIESCFSHSLEDCDDESRWVRRPDGSVGSFLRDLRDWGKVCDRIYIWDYTTGFAHYPAPHPNWHVLQPNMRTFVKNGVKGVFEQACGAIGGGADMNEMRAYVISKLLWDADTDVERHMKEFSDFYYGAAGPYVLEYIRVHTEKVIRDDIHVGFNDSCDRADLTDEMLDLYDAILAKAAKAVEGDPIRAMRVDKIRLCTRWVRLKNNAMQKGIHDPDEINKFFEDWRAHGLTRIDEWVSAETTHRALIEDVWRGTEYYHHWTDEGPERL